MKSHIYDLIKAAYIAYNMILQWNTIMIFTDSGVADS